MSSHGRCKAIDTPMPFKVLLFKGSHLGMAPDSGLVSHEYFAEPRLGWPAAAPFQHTPSAGAGRSRAPAIDAPLITHDGDGMCN